MAAGTVRGQLHRMTTAGGKQFPNTLWGMIVYIKGKMLVRGDRTDRSARYEYEKALLTNSPLLCAENVRKMWTFHEKRIKNIREILRFDT